MLEFSIDLPFKNNYKFPVSLGKPKAPQQYPTAMFGPSWLEPGGIRPVGWAVLRPAPGWPTSLASVSFLAWALG